MNIISAKLRCLRSTSVWLPLSEGWGASCPGWFILPPTQDLDQTVSSVNSYCTMILDYLVVWDINIITVKLKCLHPMFSLVILVLGVGGKLPRLVYLAPSKDLGRTVISYFLLHHNLRIFSCREMWTLFQPNWDVYIQHQFGYPCLRGGGQAVQAGLSCPPPRIWVRQWNQSILIAL